MSMEQSFHEHRAFLNRYYGVSRSFYDLTRKYYLFGRESLLAQLAKEEWTRLIEIGPGTGRNLRKLHRMRPDAKFGGVEASDKMLEYATKRCPWATFVQGFAEQTDFRKLLGAPPERVMYSYCLSMVQEPQQALEHTLEQLAPGGEIAIVDFSDFSTAPSFMRGGMLKWLRTFHVEPLQDTLLLPEAHRLAYGPWRYFVMARIRKS